jgi:hypothetical protein
MKKIYLMALACVFGLASTAQVSVTFRVDMNGETVSENGLHVAGNWQDDAGLPGEWDPSTAEMTDGDGDGIYEYTATVPPGQYEYKFINDNDWGPGEESIPIVSQKGGGNSNRVFVVSDWHADVANLPNGYLLPAITWSGSAPAGEVAVRLMIDMTNQEVGDLGVHVAGNFSNPEWTPQLSKAFEVTNGRYAFVANVAPEADYQYKFLNGDFWGTDEGVPDGCATDGNRVASVGSEDLITDAFCFGTCGPCALPGEITLTVDMSNVCELADEVYAAGTFNGYSDQAMTNNGDGTYSLTLTLDPGEYLFKFKNGPNGWENVPPACQGDGSADRPFTIEEEQVTSFTACFEQCSEECVPVPETADITFRVDMNEETVSEEGVWMIGGFTNPAWQGGASEMTDDDGDGIYEVTVEVCGAADIQYKYTNGDPNVGENEESADFEAGGCGVDNGVGGFNRTHTRSGEDEILPAFAFNSCQPLSVTELELGQTALFPNPSTGITYLDVENPNGFTLRMNIVDITGKLVRENVILNQKRNEINTSDLNAGMYFLNVVNQSNETAVFKLLVQ